MELLGINFASLLETYGAWLVGAVLFAESSLVFFLPGDSFLFTAGLLASREIIGVWPAITLGLLGAVLGNNLGYWLGKRYGEPLFEQERSRLFRPEHLTKTRHYYEKYGAVTIILARFIPVVRTIAPIFAGIGEMRYRTFVTYNFIGATIWVVGLVLAGYWLGEVVPGVDRYLLPIISLIVFVSILPALIVTVKEKLLR